MPDTRVASPEHGPWVDIHAHPGRCFLGGVDPTSAAARALGGVDSAYDLVGSTSRGEVTVVNASTVADLAVLSVGQTGIRAGRDFEPGEARANHDRQLEALSSTLAPGVAAITSADDILTAHASGTSGVFISSEGADFLEGSLDGLAAAYAHGVRSITLVHYRTNELGDIQTEDDVHGGLTDFGRDVVREMNKTGIIVDLAHATFATTMDALEVSTEPVVISHSHLAKPGAEHPRLLSAEHAQAVADGGGLIGAWPSGVSSRTLADFADEVCRLVDEVGVNHVAIGTDLDANYKPVLTRYEQFPELAGLLADRGLNARDVDSILGGNFVELFRRVVG